MVVGVTEKVDHNYLLFDKIRTFDLIHTKPDKTSIHWNSQNRHWQIQIVIGLMWTDYIDNKKVVKERGKSMIHNNVSEILTPF